MAFRELYVVDRGRIGVVRMSCFFDFMWTTGNDICTLRQSDGEMEIRIDEGEISSETSDKDSRVLWFEGSFPGVRRS